ncbi:hypothetical protein [Reinekea blandensis]|uniref:Uncharacterized protein n=1 Tax=Reinekea blandensis MED297 TaxID=314283 RepID=A4BH84_9GAMM|nr:hypothetical protein [Reinekea blandensis]EAR08583.1 hypothetical protein MED297_15215 [Reinekea sp. MED297] [Reinekea blandensis MED297]
MNSQIVKLEGVVIPDSCDLKRRHVRKGKRLTQHYLERYDRKTLIYDCFFRPDTQEYVFTGPRSLNLWFLMRRHLYVNGKKHTGRLKRMVWQRSEQTVLKAPAGATLEIKHDDFQATVPVRHSEQDRFKGMNTAHAMNKNNKLEWIRDWAQYHVNAHGLQGVVIFDNGSTDYRPEDIEATLQTVNGLEAILVIEAGFPYGPVDNSGKAIISPRFLQTSMFNLARQDAFRQARATLSVDIDELVVSGRAESIFDAAVYSRLGCLSFREHRVFPEGRLGTPYPHQAHIMKKADFKPGNTKWCVDTNGFMNRFGWAVHRFGGGFFLMTETDDFHYLHCHGTTTGWKEKRMKPVTNLKEDPQLKPLFDKYLPGNTGG